MPFLFSVNLSFDQKGESFETENDTYTKNNFSAGKWSGTVIQPSFLQVL